MWASVFSTIETTTVVFLNQLANSSSFWHALTALCASYLIYGIVLIVIIFLLERHDYHVRSAGTHILAQAILATILATAIGFVISSVVGRERPFAVIQSIIPIGSVPANSSFPSEHTWISFAFTGVFAFYSQYAKLAGILLSLAALVAVGRVAAGMHYPSDVFAGAMLGLASAYVIVRYSHPLFRWLARFDIYHPERN